MRALGLLCQPAPSSTSAICYDLFSWNRAYLVIVPFSTAPKIPVTTLLVAHGLIADALFIGLPLVMTLWRNASAKIGVAA